MFSLKLNSSKYNLSRYYQDKTSSCFLLKKIHSTFNCKISMCPKILLIDFMKKAVSRNPYGIKM